MVDHGFRVTREINMRISDLRDHVVAWPSASSTDPSSQEKAIFIA
jgi:hypothetical protein